MWKNRLLLFLKERHFLIILFSVVFLATRFAYLGPDEINPDGVNWHFRSEQFIVGLKSGQFEKTYQHYHPGVTLMWISGVPVEIYKQITGVTTYDQYNFLTFNFIAKASVVIVQFVLSLLLIYYFSKIVPFKTAYFSVFLLSLEPFFLGNSRLYHMDVLLSLFIMLGLTAAWLAMREFTLKKAIIAGFFLGMSFLTKSIGIGALFFVLAFSTAFYAHKKDMKALLKFFGTVLGSFIIFTFIFFPALWVGPVYYLTEIFSEGERVGIRNGHDQIIFGNPVEDGGVIFYPLVILMKMSPFILLGTVFYKLKIIKKIPEILKKPDLKYSLPTLYFSVFYLAYFFVMMYPAKKLDRYMLPLFPFMALMASQGILKYYEGLRSKSKKIFISVLILLFTVFYAAPIISYYPYYFTYTSPLFGSPENANKVVAQKPFGMAVPALKQFINDKYGTGKDLGFIDTKPIKAVYANSKVFDIRVNGVSDYDLLVLGVNEEIPDKVLQSKIRFRKDSSLYVNGLEYWRIYVKE